MLKFFPKFEWEIFLQDSNNDQWSLQKEGKTSTFGTDSWSELEIKMQCNRLCINPEKWFFLKVKCLDEVIFLSSHIFC